MHALDRRRSRLAVRLGLVGHVELAKRFSTDAQRSFRDGVHSALALALRAAGDA
jgi:hypothetical protein